MKLVWADNPNTSIPQLVHASCLTSDQERAAAQPYYATPSSNAICPRCTLGLLDTLPVHRLPKSDVPGKIFDDMRNNERNTTEEADRIRRVIHETLPSPSLKSRREPDPNYDTIAEKDMDKED